MHSVEPTVGVRSSPLAPLTMLAAVGLLALTWLTYLPALHGSAVWDDRPIVTQSQVLFDPHAVYRIWFDPHASPDYFPLTLTAFWLQTKLWGGAANLTGYHAVNVCLHGINALLVWAILARLRVRGALLTAALFAVHPIMVESVAWVCELKNTLSGLFALLAVLAFIRPATWVSSVAAAALFALAMLAKSAVVGLPVALLLLLWWKRQWPTRAQQAALLLMFIVATGLSALALWTQSHVVGTHGPEWNRTPLQSLSIFGPAVIFYLGKLLWPAHLALLYRQWTLPDDLSWQHALGAVILLGVALLFRYRSGRGRPMLTALLIFLVMLAPVLGLLKFFTQRYSFVADHYTYLACIPMLALFGYAVSRTGPARVPLGIGVVAVCAALSWHDSCYFVSELATFHNVVAQDPDNWEGNDMLGIDATARHDDRAAEQYFLRAARQYPLAAETWVGLGGVAERKHDYPAALDDYQRAAVCRSTSPIIRFDLANMLLVNRRVPEAIAEYRAAIDLDPTRVEPHDNLGVALLKMNDRAGAEAEFREALSLDPSFAKARRHLAALSAGPTGVNARAKP